MGFEPNAHKGKINNEFNSFINTLSDMGYIKLVKKTRYYSRYCALDTIKAKSMFSIITYDEFKVITKNVPNKSAAIMLLAYIRLNCYRKKNNNDNHPEVYFCHLSKITEHLGISSHIILSSIEYLSSLGILYANKQSNFQDKYGNWHSGVYIFVNKTRYHSDALNQSYDWQSELDKASIWLHHQYNWRTE